MAFPVEEKLGEIRRALAANREVVLTAPPGSGKTTCVPPALLGEPWLAGKKIVMLEPRRLAARNCAAYIARKLGESVGGTVGYQVRLERKVSGATRLEIVTEGLLAQRLLSDPELAGVGLVIFDEFHERSLACDLSFALALEAKRALRPDLRLVVMSATLDAGEVHAALGGTCVEAAGRMYPVETKYVADKSLQGAVELALKETPGDVLCFLPGEAEIRRALENFPVRAGVEAMPLYGALPREDQDRVFRPSASRKVVFATSIAETSLTLEGVTAVVDSGLMRVPRFSPRTGMSGLATLPLSMDRAEQRRGRAGRVCAGICYRLWSAAEEASRPKKALPEILDADLAPLVLASAAWGALRRDDLPWLTPPPAASWDQAAGLLVSLGALSSDGRLTAKGEKMARLPMHPRLANMMLCGGDAQTAARLAAIIEEGGRSRETDIRRVLDEVRETPSRPFSRRILQLARRFASVVPESSSAPCSEGALLAHAYPERVAKSRGNGTFRMVSGRGAFVDPSDPLARSPFLVCCALDDRTGDAKMFLGCPIAEEEIESIFSGQIVCGVYCAWNRRELRVKRTMRRTLGALVLREGDLGGEDDRGAENVAACLVEGVREKGVANLPCWTPAARQLRERIDFIARTLGSTWPTADDAAVLAALPAFVDGMSKWRDLEKLDLVRVMESILVAAGHSLRELDRLAPVRMEVPSGSHMLIRYGGDEPTCEVRLQECFGLMETPKIALGRVPVVMTLLSPAQRPIQITKDLAGFWRDGYALVRKDMRGRYPKHYWPEDPFTAVATRRTAKRRGGEGMTT